MARKQHKTATIDPQTARQAWSRLSVEEWADVFARVAPDHGPRLVKGSIKMRCHAHDDHRASLEVTPQWRGDEGIAKCFACGHVRFDPIELVKKLRREDYATTALWLRTEYPALRRLLTDDVLEVIGARVQAQRVRDQLVQFGCELLEKALAFPDACPQATDAITWLESRGYLRPESAWRDGGAAPSGARDPHVLTVMARRQLIGLVPSVADVYNVFGADSAENRAYDRTFGGAVAFMPMMPLHTIEGHVGRIRVRNISGDSGAPKYTYCDAWDDAADGHPGFYGMRALLENRAEQSDALPQIRIVEGETGVLTMHAYAVATSDIEFVLAGGGLSAASLDVLAHLGTRQLDLIADRGKGGPANVRRWAESVRAPITMRVLAWPTETADGVEIKANKPDELINERGGVAWVRWLANPDAWTAIVPWTVEHVTELCAGVADVAARGREALEWGTMFHDPQARAAYARDVAAQQGLDAALLQRQLDESTRPEAFAVGDHVEIGRRMLADLQGTSTVALVHAENALWRYDASAGVWREVTEGEQDRVINGYSARGLIKIKNSDAEGAKKRARGDVSAPEFFVDAPAGVAFTNGFVTVDEHGNIGVERLAPSHKLRTVLPVEYDPAAPAPRFRRFLLECLRRTHCTQVHAAGPRTCDVVHECDDTCPAVCTRQHVCWPRDVDQPPTAEWANEQRDAQEVIDVLQEFVGASLIGVATEYQRMVLAVGVGENGKSQFFDVVGALFPEACATVMPQSMSNANSCYALIGKRLNLVAEIPARELLDTAALKAAVSGDPLEVKKLFHDTGKARLTAGHMFGANELPPVNDSSHGFWRRQILTQWRHKFAGPAAEVGLARRIVRDELAGVAAWAIEGAARLIKRGGFHIPEVSRVAVSEWKSESDSVAVWVSKFTEPSADNRHDSAWLYGHYLAWAKESTFTPVNIINFGRRLKACGVKEHRSKTSRGWKLAIRYALGVEN